MALYHAVPSIPLTTVAVITPYSVLVHQGAFQPLDNVPHPIAVLDDNGNFLYRNLEFLNIMGDQSTPALFVSEMKRSLFQEQLQKGIANKQRFTLSTTCLTDAYGETDARLIVKPNIDSDRACIWTVSIVLMIPEFARIQSDYLDNVSHEMRTPLHGIMGMIESLRHSSLDPAQRDCLKYLQFSSDALYQVVNHFLNIPKLQCGILELASEPFSLYELADSLVDTYRDALVKRDVHMAFEYDVKDGTRKFVGDELRIRQILANLISNAVKFTESGSIVTRVESEVLDSTAHDLTISVMDTGKGIPEPALAKLFDTSTQFDGEARRRYSGTGIGLSLCKKLSHLMGGDVGVTSDVGHGSHFWLKVRLFPYGGIIAGEINAEGGKSGGDSADEEVGEVESGSDGSLLNQRVYRILIVEDNVINQRVLARMIDRVGFHYSIASDGKEALKLCEDMVFDAVFMDCDMPVMDGYEATRAIRMSTSNFCASIPIIAVTASGGDTVRQRCLESGMNDVLMKPVNQKEIMKALKNWLPIPDGDA
ncbi:hypothetical protein HK097_008298 [Rhizophlyctis rosea]|uniref:Histidine kinase n=1 Tax=Rhizophlyctis rosea TaxID=64517 RepID=A0AAD5SAF4_9FUNG|nr:hypothetical protein HK097_008298 [Rhizophlyctis rosea]